MVMDPGPAMSELADLIATLDAYADRVAVGRPLEGWRVSDGPYATVDNPVQISPDLRGDGLTQADVTRFEVSVWQAEQGDAGALLARTVGRIDGAYLPTSGQRLTCEGWTPVPEPETGLTRSAITVRYAASRQ